MCQNNKMALPVLLIAHASLDCTEEQVKKVFAELFEEDIIKKVVVSSKFDHKTFGIHFNKTNALLDAFAKHIDIFKIKHICYDKDFYRERFIWHVSKVNAMERLDATDKYTTKDK